MAHTTKETPLEVFYSISTFSAPTNISRSRSPSPAASPPCPSPTYSLISTDGSSCDEQFLTTHPSVKLMTRGLQVRGLIPLKNCRASGPNFVLNLRTGEVTLEAGVQFPFYQSFCPLNRSRSPSPMASPPRPSPTHTASDSDSSSSCDEITFVNTPCIELTKELWKFFFYCIKFAGTKVDDDEGGARTNLENVKELIQIFIDGSLTPEDFLHFLEDFVDEKIEVEVLRMGLPFFVQALFAGLVELEGIHPPRLQVVSPNCSPNYPYPTFNTSDIVLSPPSDDDERPNNNPQGVIYEPISEDDSSPISEPNRESKSASSEYVPFNSLITKQVTTNEDELENFLLSLNETDIHRHTEISPTKRINSAGNLQSSHFSNNAKRKLSLESTEESSWTCETETYQNSHERNRNIMSESVESRGSVELKMKESHIRIFNEIDELSCRPLDLKRKSDRTDTSEAKKLCRRNSGNSSSL